MRGNKHKWISVNILCLPFGFVLKTDSLQTILIEFFFFLSIFYSRFSHYLPIAYIITLPTVVPYTELCFKMIPLNAVSNVQDQLLIAFEIEFSKILTSEPSPKCRCTRLLWIPTLLYASETWKKYRQHLIYIEKFH